MIRRRRMNEPTVVASDRELPILIPRGINPSGPGHVARKNSAPRIVFGRLGSWRGAPALGARFVHRCWDACPVGSGAAHASTGLQRKVCSCAGDLPRRSRIARRPIARRLARVRTISAVRFVRTGVACATTCPVGPGASRACMVLVERRVVSSGGPIAAR